MNLTSPTTKWGCFVNTQGYVMTKVGDNSWCYLWNVTDYTVVLSPISPLMWFGPEGQLVMTGPVFNSDGASTPPLMWNLPGLDPDRFLLPALLHDFGCKYGGMFIRCVGESKFTFRRLSRLDMDNYLYKWVGADGGNAFQQWEYYHGVRIGALWMKYPEIGYWDDLNPAQ